MDSQQPPRNDISKLTAAGIPARLGKFSCGCWGKHQPPYIADGEIVFDIGEGYRSNKHQHGQNLYVLAADADQHVALVEMRKYGDLYGAGLWHYLIGLDAAPFIAQVSSNVDDLAVALEKLKPAEVRRAEAEGAQITRQGDWFFIPVPREPRGEVQASIALDDDHIADEFVGLKTAAYVRGLVSHKQHTAIHLDGWHKAVRNNAIRIGYLSGRGAD